MDLPNIEIKKILYATDLSENARYAFAYAVSLANLYGAKIVLLHILPEVPDKLDSQVVGYIRADQWEDIKSRHVQEARDSLIGKRRDHHAIKAVLGQFSSNAMTGSEDPSDLTDDIVVKRGHPEEEIIKEAEEKNCDMIVMGTQGRGSLEDTMMGSTARRVIRRSEKPVLVVRLPK